MFATIKTNGATEIIINIPLEGAEKSLPALAAMLENNAIFLQKGWRELKEVEPEINVTLGSEIKADGGEQEIIIKASGSSCIVDDSFKIATSDVYISNAKALAKKEEEISKFRTENSFLKGENERLKEQLNALINPEVPEEE